MENDSIKNYSSNFNSDTSSGPKYFAADTAEKLASACLGKAQSFYKTLNSNFYLDLLARCWQSYHGDYNNTFSTASHQINFTGEQGELVQLPVNHFRNIASHMLNMITASRPTMEARAVNTDYKSLSQTYLANGILDYYMREKKLEDVIKRATEMAIVMGSGYVRLEWNATAGELYDFDPDTGEKNFQGEIEYSTLSPFDVVFDGTKETWNNEWILIRTFQNRFNLAAKYPELKEKIMGIHTKQEGSVYKMAVFSNDSTDDIPVYEFFHKRTEAVQEGRYVLFVDSDVVLLDLPLPYRDIPVYRVSAGEFMGTPYGYTPMFDVYPIQEGINSLYSTIMTNQNAFGVQNLFIQKGADLDFNSLDGALNIIEGNFKPEALSLASTPEEVFRFLQTLEQAAETISGVNSVTRGNPEASLKSGTALALVQSMSLQFMSGLQNNYVKLIEDTGTSLINILKDYAKTPKTVALVGKNNKYLLKEFTGDSLDSINRVIVSVGNPLARSVAGRVQMAEQMLQMGLITNPKEYFQVINTGSIETMYESDMNENLLIKRENELLMEESDEPVIADMLDEHSTHILEHRTVLADPELRRNPILRQRVQDHIQQHIEYLRTVDKDLLMLIKQQPLMGPNDAPPPPPPGGPQGGPPMPPPPQGMGNVDPMMQPPGGLPQGGDMIQNVPGQGAQMPNLPSPPPPFDTLPVQAQDMLPQS